MYRLGVAEDDIKSIVTYDAKKYNSLREMFASISSGGYVKIPVGTYEETYIILDGLSDLVIDGNGFLSKIVFNDMISTLDGTAYYKAGEGVHFVVNNCSNIRFKNFAIEGVYDNTMPTNYSHGFVISGTSDEIYIENISLSKICGEGILNNSAGKVVIENCNIQNIRNSGIGSVTSTGVIKAYKNVLKNVCYQTTVGAISINCEWDFQNNYVEAQQTGVKIGHSGKTGTGKILNNIIKLVGTLSTQTCFSLEECEGMTISGNTVQGFYYGLNGSSWTVGDNVIISNNRFLSIGNIAISSLKTKTNLLIAENYIDSGVDGININNSLVTSVIRGNTIKNITGKGINILSASAGLESHDIEITKNKITGGTYGIYIGGRNYRNIIRNDNVLSGQSTAEIYSELSNTYSTSLGNIIEYNFATTPVLDGTPDNSNQTPSLNKGSSYVLPAASAGGLYNVVRFDNANVGQIVSFLAVDAYTVFKNGNNISLPADVTTAAGKVYTFKGIASGGTLKYYLVSVN